MFLNGLIPHFFGDSLLLVCLGIAAVAIIPYLLGSVNSAILISKLVYQEDIRNHGSKNAGLTNMHRTFGLKAAGLTLLGDMLKTILSILVAFFLFGFSYSKAFCTNPFAFVAGAAAVLGHVFPVYYGFKGGKGVLVTSTMALMLTPPIFGVLLLIFIGMVAMTKYISLGSVTVALLYPVCLSFYSLTFFLKPLSFSVASVSILLAVFIVWLHRENLKRIGNRTERKFSFKKKGEEKTQKSEEDSEDDE